MKDHPDRYALEYIDAKIEQHKARSLKPNISEYEHIEQKAAAFALGIVRGDIFALLHRPAPVAAACTHPIDRQIDDTLRNVGPTIRCRECGEHRPRSSPAD